MANIYAERIREIRQIENMTQEEFAASIGTTKNQLSKYELGIQDTPTKIILAVCSEFNVDANWLLGLSNGIRRREFSAKDQEVLQTRGVAARRAPRTKYGSK